MHRVDDRPLAESSIRVLWIQARHHSRHSEDFTWKGEENTTNSWIRRSICTVCSEAYRGKDGVGGRGRLRNLQGQPLQNSDANNERWENSETLKIIETKFIIARSIAIIYFANLHSLEITNLIGHGMQLPNRYKTSLSALNESWTINFAFPQGYKFEDNEELLSTILIHNKGRFDFIREWHWRVDSRGTHQVVFVDCEEKDARKVLEGGGDFQSSSRLRICHGPRRRTTEHDNQQKMQKMQTRT